MIDTDLGGRLPSVTTVITRRPDGLPRQASPFLVVTMVTAVTRQKQKTKPLLRPEFQCRTKPARANLRLWLL
ncbi:MAG TPA: hypothetical protein VEC93_06310, partial [Anaerolineae bacterium]|nr:hypothetical protein [Anaerolineae bacterium]